MNDLSELPERARRELSAPDIQNASVSLEAFISLVSLESHYASHPGLAPGTDFDREQTMA